jgi:hypothetical protein
MNDKDENKEEARAAIPQALLDHVIANYKKPAGQNVVKRRKYFRGLAPNQRIGSFGDGHRPLCVLPQRNAPDAERARFFLQPA